MCTIFFPILMFHCEIDRNTVMSTYILSLNSNSNELVRILISSFLGNRKGKFNLKNK